MAQLSYISPFYYVSCVGDDWPPGVMGHGSTLTYISPCYYVSCVGDDGPPGMMGHGLTLTYITVLLDDLIS